MEYHTNLANYYWLANSPPFASSNSLLLPISGFDFGISGALSSVEYLPSIRIQFTSCVLAAPDPHTMICEVGDGDEVKVLATSRSDLRRLSSTQSFPSLAQSFLHMSSFQASSVWSLQLTVGFLVWVPSSLSICMNSNGIKSLEGSVSVHSLFDRSPLSNSNIYEHNHGLDLGW